MSLIISFKQINYQNIRYILIIFLVLIILPSELFSQQIGRIYGNSIDKSNDEKIIDANAIAVGITLSASTNIYGNQTLTFPSDFNLNQNYPNPFNPSTEIVYSVAQPSKVKLTVTNILGQVVETLVNDFRSTGTYEVTFDAKNLISGLYIYTLEAGSTNISKKMTLLK